MCVGLIEGVRQVAVLVLEALLQTNNRTAQERHLGIAAMYACIWATSERERRQVPALV
jgi:hypothetical protein